MNDQVTLLDDDELNASIIEHADKLSDIAKSWPMDAQALFEHLKANFEKDHDETKAAELAVRALTEMSGYGGGMQFYLPKKETFFTALRDIQIWQLYDGRNVRQLARRFNLTPARIYAILTEQRKIEVQRNQFPLF